MRSLQQLLHEKEMDLERVRKEVEALRFVAPMLADQKEPVVLEIPRLDASSKNRWPLDVNQSRAYPER